LERAVDAECAGHNERLANIYHASRADSCASKNIVQTTRMWYISLTGNVVGATEGGRNVLR
jgi:hypothetical protein